MAKREGGVRIGRRLQEQGRRRRGECGEGKENMMTKMASSEEKDSECDERVKEKSERRWSG